MFGSGERLFKAIQVMGRQFSRPARRSQRRGRPLENRWPLADRYAEAGGGSISERDAVRAGLANSKLQIADSKWGECPVGRVFRQPPDEADFECLAASSQTVRAFTPPSAILLSS